MGCRLRDIDLSLPKHWAEVKSDNLPYSTGKLGPCITPLGHFLQEPVRPPNCEICDVLFPLVKVGRNWTRVFRSCCACILGEPDGCQSRCPDEPLNISGGGVKQDMVQTIRKQYKGERKIVGRMSNWLVGLGKAESKQ